VCVTAISSWVTGESPFSHQLAATPTQPPQTIAFTPQPAAVPPQNLADGLVIGLDRPVVDIPQATLMKWDTSGSH
jgi:hypothetical protein